MFDAPMFVNGVCQTSCPPISCGVSDFRGADFELRPCSRTLGYFIPVRERGTKWDNSDKQHPWARTRRLPGLIRPVPAAHPTAEAAWREKGLSLGKIQAILASRDMPLGECRVKTNSNSPLRCDGRSENSGTSCLASVKRTVLTIQTISKNS